MLKEMSEGTKGTAEGKSPVMGGFSKIHQGTSERANTGHAISIAPSCLITRQTVPFPLTLPPAQEATISCC